MTNSNPSIDKCIEKVFNFYSRQQALLGKAPTFDSILHNVSTLSKGKFLKFCIDFQFGLKQDEVLSLFSRAVGFSSEMNLAQFKIALFEMKTKEDFAEFCVDFGLDDVKTCLTKCKPFSSKLTSSLPKLPELTQRPRLRKDLKLSVAASTSSLNTKASIFNRVASSNLPAGAISVPRFSSRGNSYHIRHKNQKDRFKPWSDLRKIDAEKIEVLYGNLQLSEFVVSNECDDDVLNKFGY